MESLFAGSTPQSTLRTRNTFGKKLNKYENRTNNCQFVIIDLTPVAHVDTSGLHILHDVFKTYKEQGIKMCFSNPNVTVMNTFLLDGFDKMVGSENMFVNTHDAVVSCTKQYEQSGGDSAEKGIKQV